MVDAVSARVKKGEGPCTRPNSISVSKQVAEALGLAVGDVVQVAGGKTTVAVVESIETLPEMVVFLGRTVRPNADAHWDENVHIKRLEKKEVAKKTVIGPAEEDQSLEVDADALKGTLVGLYVNAGDLLEIGKRSLRQIFSDTGGQRTVRVHVVETKPSGIVQIAEDTELIVNRGFHQAETMRRTTTVTYDDIGGMKDPIEKLRELVEIPIRNPHLFEKLGIDPPKGVLLHGPPGVGKTLLAKATANESGAYFIGTGAAQLAAGVPGETERRLREIFAEAEQHQPSIIFFDEFDTIAPKREETQSPDERRIVGVLLELLDGMKKRGQVIVMAATNRPDAIDQALRRPGRFDREVEIPIPNEDARLEILRIQTRYMPLEDDVDLPPLAENTHGYSGADLNHLCGEAALSCVRRNRAQFRPDGTIPEQVLAEMKIGMSDFAEGSKRITPSCARDIVVEIPKVRLDQVGGYKDLKQKIEELVLVPWRHRQEARKFGVKVPRGILLYGEPGTGKTLTAKAIATEAKTKVVIVSGARLKSKWFGDYEKNIARIFEVARKAAPVIVIFDEIESIASVRGGGTGDGGKTALDNGLNELLQQLDGIEEMHDVFLICTTNRPDMLDPAFIRSGRVEYQFYMARPDDEARAEIFRVHLSETKMPLAKDVSVERLTRVTEGSVGADIWRIVRSATLKCFCEHVRNGNGQPALEMRHFLAAIDDLHAGLTSRRRSIVAPLSVQTQ